YLQALKSGVIEGDEELYTALIKESNRIQDMISELDQLKQWNQFGKDEKKAEEFSVKHVIDQVLSMIWWQLNRKEISTIVDIEDVLLKGDPVGFEQAMNNIISNAIEYYDGEGDIIISGKKSQNDYVMIISGPGKRVPAEDQAHIFDRFYRVDASRSRATGGSGLGLAITKEIVHFHGGKISFTSQDKRNLVTVTIPIHA